MSEPGRALRATSDALLADLQALEELEHQKRELAPDDPELVTTARSVEEIARRLLGLSVRQRELTTVIKDLADVSDPRTPERSIEETPREIHQILADWREAERRSRDAETGSAEATAAATEVDRLREEYRAAHENARRKR